MMQIEELKLCPFCGGRATLCAEGLSTLRFQVVCDSCLCGTGYCGSADKIKEAWNTRTHDRNLLLTLDKARDGMQAQYLCDGDDCHWKLREALSAIEKFNPAIKLVKEEV